MLLTGWLCGAGLTPDCREQATGKHHIYASAMTHNCSLQHWGTNSRIEHGISDTITGPFVFSDVAVNTFAHASNPMRLNDGSYAIV